MSSFSKFLKFLLILIALVAFSGLAMYLFFPEQYSKITAYFYKSQTAGEQTEKQKLVIAFARSVTDLEPTSMDPNTRNRLLQIYEPMIKTDKFLNIIPSLALTYGQINTYGQVDAKVWFFRIRPDIKFHNGKNLTIDDISASLSRAQTHKKSQMKNIVSSMHFTPIDAFSFIITTDYPDPLFLQKLSFVLIMPKENTGAETVAPVGTGPYKYVNTELDGTMNLTKFDSYWGNSPSSKNLVIKVIPNQEERIKDLVSHKIDVLGDVPPSYIEDLDKAKIEIKKMPSFEVTFLLFNMNSNIFSDKNLRQVANMSIDKKRFMLSSVGYTKAVNQFVSSGVFGFNQNIRGLDYDAGKASEITNSISEFKSLPIKFAVPSGMFNIGKDITSMLQQAGFEVTMLSRESEDFEKDTRDPSIDLYLMGWKSEIADSQDFLQSVVHSRDEKKSFGMYNAGKYSNKDIDKMIEENIQEMNASKRLKAFQNIMKTIVEEDIIGVPLFETQIIYGVNKDINFEPRADGYILANEIS